MSMPDDYQIGVSGQVTGVGPNGGQLLVDMGPTLANTEANETENHRALALVTLSTLWSDTRPWLKETRSPSAASPARRPKTRHSSIELDASRLAPWTPVHAHSPAA